MWDVRTRVSSFSLWQQIFLRGWLLQVWNTDDSINPLRSVLFFVFEEAWHFCVLYHFSTLRWSRLFKIHRGEDKDYFLFCIVNSMASDSQGILNCGTNLILSEKSCLNARRSETPHENQSSFENTWTIDAVATFNMIWMSQKLLRVFDCHFANSQTAPINLSCGDTLTAKNMLMKAFL